MYVFLFPLGEKWFPSLIELERQPFGVLKLFFELSINTPGHILKTLRFLSLRYSADFRRSRLVDLQNFLATFFQSFVFPRIIVAAQKNVAVYLRFQMHTS